MIGDLKMVKVEFDNWVDILVNINIIILIRLIKI